jgi:hypothetical protein
MKATNLAFGILMLLASLAAFAGSGLLLYRAAPDLKVLVHSRFEPVEREETCLEAGKRLGFTARVAGDGSVHFTLARLSEPQKRFGEASAIAMSCLGYSIERFCAGEDCGRDQMVLVMQKSRNKALN